MAKRYITYRSDLADKTELDAEISAGDANNYPVGAVFVCANGSMYVVSANDGASVTTIAVGAQTA